MMNFHRRGHLVGDPLTSGDLHDLRVPPNAERPAQDSQLFEKLLLRVVKLVSQIDEFAHGACSQPAAAIML